MRLSVLDLSPVLSGGSSADALKSSIDLARHAEALGFERYWVAEHHNAASVACSSPEIMIAEIACATSRIRVGSGGVMLPNHSPLKVAESFRVLAALHPDRIDLGVGRAAGTDNATALALRRSRELLGAERFPTDLEQLLAFLSTDPDPHARFGPMKAVPTGVPAPPVFVLGSGGEGASIAARLGLGFAFAHQLAPGGHVEATARYRAAFAPSARFDAPYTLLSVSVICGASDAHADELARSFDVAGVRFGQGIRDLPLPSVEEARAYPFDADEEAIRLANRARHVIGGPPRVADALRRLAEEARADELLVMTSVHDHDERKRSYERLARAVGV